MIFSHPWSETKSHRAVRPVSYSSNRLREVVIASACGFQLVGFADARPLRRSSALHRARYQRLRQILSVSEETARRLREYILSQAHHELDHRPPGVVPASFPLMPRATLGDDEMARIGAALMGMGLIGLRGSGAQEGVVLPPVFSGRLSLSNAGRWFLFRRESWKGRSEHLHWPGGRSGVTLGPGYDFNGAGSKKQIIADLIAIGIDPIVAKTAAEGFDRRDERARHFAQENKNLITLTETQQEALLQITTPKYENNANRSLNDDIKQRLFSHEYDALISFTYNHGSLGPTLLNRMINEGRLDENSITTGFNQFTPDGDSSRRLMEIRLFTQGLYA